MQEKKSKLIDRLLNIYIFGWFEKYKHPNWVVVMLIFGLIGFSLIIIAILKGINLQ